MRAADPGPGETGSASIERIPYQFVTGFAVPCE